MDDGHPTGTVTYYDAGIELIIPNCEGWEYYSVDKKFHIFSVANAISFEEWDAFFTSGCLPDQFVATEEELGDLIDRLCYGQIGVNTFSKQGGLEVEFAMSEYSYLVTDLTFQWKGLYYAWRECVENNLEALAKFVSCPSHLLPNNQETYKGANNDH